MSESQAPQGERGTLAAKLGATNQEPLLEQELEWVQPRMVWASKSHQHTVQMETAPSDIKASLSKDPRIRQSQDKESLLFHRLLTKVQPRLAQHKTQFGGALRAIA